MGAPCRTQTVLPQPLALPLPALPHLQAQFWVYLLGPYTDTRANTISPTNIATIISQAAAPVKGKNPGGPLTQAKLTTGDAAKFTGSVSAGVQWNGKNYLAGVTGSQRARQLVASAMMGQRHRPRT